MNAFVLSVQGVFDQLNPFNTGNLVLYFSWVVLFAFTMMGVWRSPRGGLRLLCFVVNQAMSVGIILSWTLTALLAYTFWWQSLAAFFASALLGFVLFSPRRRRANREFQ